MATRKKHTPEQVVHAAVDPEAFSDFHGEHPFIELRDPAAIVKPWRPGSGIVARQAAAMAQIGAGLSRPRDTKGFGRPKPP